MPADIDRAKYISFTSFKRNGDAVALPVWVVPFEGGYAFTTDGPSFKVKRVRSNPAVTVQVCSFRGKVAPGAATHSGTAEVLEGDEVAAVRRAIKRKYRVVYAFAIAPQEWLAKLRRKESTGSVAIKITLSGGAAA
jgi:PPOX class probable F420-dependent enzyme